MGIRVTRAGGPQKKIGGMHTHRVWGMSLERPLYEVWAQGIWCCDALGNPY